MRCFSPHRYTYHGTTDTCICGKFPIRENYYITNIKTKEELIVGSTCAKNWFNEIKGNGCMYCSRNNKKGGNCIDCSGKKNLKSVFSSWKTYTKDRKDEREKERLELNEKVSFGRFQHLTYMHLCKYNMRYVRWCLDESGMKDSTTRRLRYFYDKFWNTQMHI